MKVLVVEDDRAVRSLLVRVLRARAQEPQFRVRHLEILEADNLDDALRLAKNIDAVLCDGNFPTHRQAKKARSAAPPQNWMIVEAYATSERIRFALLSGDPRIVNWARSHMIPAFAKPRQVDAAVRFVLSPSGVDSGPDAAEL